MRFGSELTIDKIVMQAGKPLTITAAMPDNKNLVEFLNARKGRAMNAELSDLQGELGLEPGLEDLRLPAGFIEQVDLEGEGPAFPADFENAQGITLREKNGYPYLVICPEGMIDPDVPEELSAPIILDFPALISWIKEDTKTLLGAMAKIDKASTQAALEIEGDADAWDDLKAEFGEELCIVGKNAPDAIPDATVLDILRMPFEDMLRKHRFAPAGDPLFQNPTGTFFAEVMEFKKRAAGGEEWTRLSKKIGFAEGQND